jgi:hypothetical protein
MRDLLADMERGVRNMDVKTIRDAANKATALGNMITPAASERLQNAIDTARRAARQIVRAGEQAAQEIDYRAVRAITESRTAFLDLDDAQEIAAPTVTGRAMDLDESDIETSSAGPERRQIDMEDADPMNAAAPAAVPQLELL